MNRVILILATVVMVGCAREVEVPVAEAAPPEPAPPVSGPLPPGTETVARIPLEDAVEALNRGDAVLVDVRSEEAYHAAHARGAIHIPEAEILNRLADMPMGKTIITYCT